MEALGAFRQARRSTFSILGWNLSPSDWGTRGRSAGLGDGPSSNRVEPILSSPRLFSPMVLLLLICRVFCRDLTAREPFKALPQGGYMFEWNLHHLRYASRRQEAFLEGLKSRVFHTRVEPAPAPCLSRLLQEATIPMQPLRARANPSRLDLKDLLYSGGMHPLHHRNAPCASASRTLLGICISSFSNYFYTLLTRDSSPLKLDVSITVKHYPC